MIRIRIDVYNWKVVCGPMRFTLFCISIRDYHHVVRFVSKIGQNDKEFRLFALFAFVFSVLQASGIVPAEIKNNMIVFGFGPIILLTCWVIGPLLTRLLCKDMRDVTNPNWKAASAIRRIAYFEPLTHMATIMGVAVTNKTLLYTHMAGIHTLAALMPMMAFWLTSIGEWFSYLIFTQRRFLKNNDTLNISRYFGFTSLGVNGSIASEIRSKLSSITNPTRQVG